tara:strand:+ start:73 stop:525 length:453 start_codon:yes stop_codon:yes gene_type:complete
MNTNIISFKTRYGWITALEKNKKIIEIRFGKSKSVGNSNNLLKLKNNINRFFSKKTKKIDFKIFLDGSNLQIKIWKELRKIPYGKTRSYGDIAKIVKTSARYVGNVCGQNKHLLIVPCHRVIRGDGSLGGFSAPGGINIKKRLLKMEKIG